MAKTTTEVAIFIKLRDQATRKFPRLAAAVKLTGKLLRGMGRVGVRALRLISKAALRAGRAISRVAMGIGKMGAAAATAGLALGAIVGARLVKGIIEAGSMYENLRKQLETSFRGNRKAAGDFFDWLRKRAARSAADTAQFVTGGALLKNVGLTVEETKRALKGLEAAAVNRGVDMAELIETVMGEPTERLRRFGIQTTTEAGKLTLKFGSMVIKTGATVRERMLGIAKILEHANEGAVGRMANTWTGATNTIMGLWQDFKASIAEAGFLQHITTMVRSFVDMWDKLVKAGTVKLWAKSLSDMLVSASNWIPQILKWVVSIANELWSIGEAVMTIWKMWADNKNQAGDVIIWLAAKFRAEFFQAIRDIATAIGTEFQKIGDSMAESWDPIFRTIGQVLQNLGAASHGVASAAGATRLADLGTISQIERASANQFGEGGAIGLLKGARERAGQRTAEAESRIDAVVKKMAELNKESAHEIKQAAVDAAFEAKALAWRMEQLQKGGLKMEVGGTVQTGGGMGVNVEIGEEGRQRLEEKVVGGALAREAELIQRIAMGTKAGKRKQDDFIKVGGKTIHFANQAAGV